VLKVLKVLIAICCREEEGGNDDVDANDVCIDVGIGGSVD
jgi:hypothetical protein